MSGGPLTPLSWVPAQSTTRIGPGAFVGGTNGRVSMGQAVEAALGGDASIFALFKLPPAIPSGTPTLTLYGLSAGTGNARIQLKWAAGATGTDDVDTVSLTSETLETWAIGATDPDEYVKALTGAPTFSGKDWLILEVSLATASWTLASVLVLPAPILEWL